MNYEYAIIVKNKTRLEALVERFNTKSQAKFYIERSGGFWQDYETEHDTFHRSLTSVQQQLSLILKNKIVERSFLPSFIFSEKQVVVVVGQDGLVANTAKYVNGLPMVAVNPDPERYDGVLLPFRVNSFLEGVKDVLNRDYLFRTAVLAEARLNDGQRLLAFNDLFIGADSHVSARYKISYGGREENHSSSGIIVSTPSGATGWLSSVFNMSNGLTRFFGQESHCSHEMLPNDQLMFVVREPFRSKRSQVDLVAGIINRQSSLQVESFMPTNGVIFSDGIENDFVHFNSGSIVRVGMAEETAKIVSPKL